MYKLLKSRPITVVGLLSALHSIIYGFGFLLAVGGFDRAILYIEVGLFYPFGQEIFGIILILAGIITMTGYLANKARLIRWGSGGQSFLWAFAAFTYFLTGQILLGLGVAMIWSVISTYMAFLHKNVEDIRDYAVLTGAR